MGRRRAGPRQLKPGGPYCAVLHVPKDLRARVCKERLIRSLKTHNHSEALRRYGNAIRELEEEPEALLGGGSLRTRVENNREIELTKNILGPTSGKPHPLTPLELAEGMLGTFNPDDPVHQDIYEAFESGKPLLTWDEALETHVKVSNRNRAMSFSDSSLYK